MDENIGIGNGIGKIILMGEHAVVYGQPALAIPFPLVNVKTIIRSSKEAGKLNCSFHKGLIIDGPKKISGLITVIKQIIHSFDEKLEGLNINIESSIPPERGMGSSAAVAVATIRALYDYFNKSLGIGELFKWTKVSEKIVHGNPSGIDMAIVINEQPLYYIKEKPSTPLECNIDGYLIVGDTGQMGQTKFAVSKVREAMEANPQRSNRLIKEIGDLTNKAKIYIQRNAISDLGQSMIKAHEILIELGVSNNSLDNLVSTAMNNNALGAKLTGGGQGGCIIALASNKSRANLIANKLLENGAKDTWIMDMGVDLQ